MPDTSQYDALVHSTSTPSTSMTIDTGLSQFLTPFAAIPDFITNPDNVISNIVVYFFDLVVIRIPSLIYGILSMKVSFSISFSTLLLVGLVIGVASLTVVRYRLLTGYSRLSLDDEPDSNGTDNDFLYDPEAFSFKSQRKRFDSYLDEFLFAIKIFGYLEKPVFNELTKSMRTQKLEKMETLQMDETLGFAIVVEGDVQIFTKIDSNKSTNDQDQSTSPDRTKDNTQTEVLHLNGQKYQLLNEVKTGNSLSSLINILTLFTEDNNNNNDNQFSSTYSSPVLRHRHPLFLDNQGIPSLNLNDSFTSSAGKSPGFTNCDDFQSQQQQQTFNNLEPAPEIIARATSESTIAIIPAEAFIRLKNKYPRASSHIVQMILTRLFRVTLQTAHNYLGLTREILETEIKLNKELKSSFSVPEELVVGLKKSNGTWVDGKSKKNTKATSSSPSTSESGPRRSSDDSAFSSLASTSAINLQPSLYSSAPSPSPKSCFKTTDSIKEVDQSSSPTHMDIDPLRLTLVDAMFQFLGVTKSSLLPSLKPSSLNSTNGSVTNSPIPPGFGLYATFPSIDTLSSDQSIERKPRTWSSSSASKKGVNYNDQPLLDYDTAKEDFAKLLQIITVSPDTILIEQNSRNNGLYYVVEGCLDVIYTDPGTKKEQLIYKVEKGGIAGYLSSLIGYKSFVTVKARGQCTLGCVSRSHLEKLCEKYFMIYLTIAKSLIGALSKTVLQLDSALEWIQLDSGETLFKQDTNANGIYIMLSGRLRSIHKDPQTNEITVRNEYCQGESFGEVEVLTASKRSSTFIALRDSETARIPRSLFEILALENPSIMIKVSRIVANTVKDRVQDVLNPGIGNIIHNSANFKTITILPTTAGLPVNEFSSQLIQAFEKVNRSVIGLNQQTMLTHLGKYAFDKLSTLRQSGFFSDLEERFQIVVYIADTNVNSSWTSSCIQQGDCILLLADADANPQVGEYEKLLLKTRRTSAKTELILLHPEKYVKPGSTNKWLKNRIWVDSHHHILFNVRETKKISATDKLTDRTLTLLSSSKNYLQNQYQKLYTNLQNNPLSMNLINQVETLGHKIQLQLKSHSVVSSTNYNSTQQLRPYKNDFLRLARILSNQAVGVVLGGGGARGMSHLGVLRALEENGIPVDIIGGTSIGSFIGGLYAMDYDIVPLYGRAKKFALRIANLWRMLFDITIPTASYTTGHEFNRGLFKSFGEYRIEDFWLQYFCNSTNITTSCMEVHSSGYAWRFIRASMSLAGLLPPIIDQNGSMLLDGGYINNLPVEEIRNCSVIFAVDVGSADDKSPQQPCDSVSGFWILFNRWNPFSTTPKFPSMSEIQMRLCYVSSVNQLERAKVTPGVIYLRPPIEDYATLDFGKFEEIYNVGAIYGDMALKDLIDSGNFPQIQGTEYAGGEVDESTKGEGRYGVQRRNSI